MENKQILATQERLSPTDNSIPQSKSVGHKNLLDLLASYEISPAQVEFSIKATLNSGSAEY
jgi:hypothetical protein